MTGSHDDFTTLSLHIPATHVQDQKLSTESLLVTFLTPERMPRDTRLNDKVWTCQHCQECSNPERTFTFDAVPDTLIIHFKRWTWNSLPRGTPARAALLRQAIEPSGLITLNDAQYNLVACVYYKGDASQGHYVTIALHDAQWWLYNDGCMPLKCAAPKAELQHNGLFMSYLCVYAKS